MKLKNGLLTALACAAATLFASGASASSGTVSGGLGFFQNQGNFCPTTRVCTGAKYLQSQYNTTQPIANVKVYVERASDGATLGQGTTDASGNFSLAWTDSSTSGAVAVQITWYGEQKDGRFRLATTAGGRWRMWWSNTLAASGTTFVGTGVWGSSGSPHALSNLYDGAQKMWANALSQSNRMNSYFTGVQLQAFDATACPTSCANGPNNIITIDSAGSAYTPQGRAMHEMGHIASYRGSRNQSWHQLGALDYTFGGTGGWSLNSAEFASVHFEEAVATHLADIGLYFDNASQPHTCLSASACATGSFNLETSLGTSCGVNVNRQPINADRYFWDNYDSLVDYTGETLNRGIWEVVDTINAFDPGANNRQQNEMWNAAGTALDDNVGRSAIDFRENWITWGTNSTTELSNNCGSAGG